MLTLLAGTATAGLLAGVIAGLLGVGGGIVIVPVLLFLFLGHGIDPAIAMQLAVGTSLATIVATNIVSTRSHHLRGAVRWNLVKNFTPGVLIGALIGAQIAAALPGGDLRLLFGLFEIGIGLHMLRGNGTAETHEEHAPPSRPPLLQALFGVGIGVISALFGIGGGTLSVPVLTLILGVPIRQAVATSSGIGIFIAVFGAAGFIQAGWGHPALPEESLGFVLPVAFLGIVSTTLLTAPLGVKLAHTLHPDKLKKVFALFLILIGIKLVLG